MPLARALADGGLGVLEVTLRTPVALRAISAIRAALPAVEVGAGTVREPGDLQAAIRAGAHFAVSPEISADCARRLVSRDVALNVGLGRCPIRYREGSSEVTMKSVARAVSLMGLLFFVTCVAAATVVVSFADPAQYADAPRFGSSDAVVRGIAAHLQDLGERYLPAGATLRIEVLDLDLAGGSPYRARETRVLSKSDTWPGARLRYSLEADRQVVLRGEERIADKDFTVRFNTYPPSDPLRYEKRMLDDWFQSRIVERKPVDVPAGMKR